MNKYYCLLVLFSFLVGTTRAQYVRSFNFPGMTGGLGLAPTNDGGFVGTGQHNGGLAGACDNYVYKLNTCGELMWYKTYGSAGSDGGRKVIEAQDGGVLVSGLYDSDGGDGYDYLLQKLDANGNQQWITVWNNLNGNSNDYAHWVTEVSNQIIVSGSTTGFPYGGWDAVVSSYSSTGNHQWSKAFGGAGEDNLCSVHAAPTHIYIGGITTSFGAGSRDLMVIKTDLQGNVIWMNAYGTPGVEGGYWDTEGTPTLDGGYLMTGSTDQAGLTAGGRDILVVKLDSLGNVEWSKSYGGPSNDWSEGVLVSPAGGYAIVGTSESYTNGGRDAVLLKIDDNGNFEWANSYGQAGCDRGVDVIAKDGGYVLSMNYNNNLSACGVDNEYDPMFIKTDSVGNCGCSFVNAPYTSIDMTTSTVTTPLNPTTASQIITSNVQVYSPPVIEDAPAVNENTICSVCTSINPQWAYNDTVGCHGDTLKFYNQTASSVGCFYWESSNVGTLSSGDTLLFVLDTTYGLNQQVMLISVCGTLSDTLYQDVVVKNKPTANFYQETVCLMDTSFFLDSSIIATSDTIVSWSWDFGNGGGSTVPSTNYIYSQPGTYQVELKVVSNLGCADSIVYSHLVHPIPYTYAGLDTTINCSGDSVMLDGSLSDHGIYYANSWSTTNGIILGNSDSLFVYIDSVGTYVLESEDLNTGCLSRDSLVVTLDTVKPNFNYQDTILNCSYPMVFLTAFINPQNPYYLFEWTTVDGNILFGNSTDSPLVDSAGTYVATITNSLNQCVTVDSLLVSMDTVKPIVNILLNGAIAWDESIYTFVENIYSYVGDTNTFVWYIDGQYLTEDSVFNYTFFDENEHDITIVMTNMSNGCVNADTLFLNVTHQLKIPSAFSPNSDGWNDVFEILELQAFDHSELVIFNRWGDVVYQATPYQNNWIGQSNTTSLKIGEEVVDGTYFYTLKLTKDGEEQIFKGSVELKR
ncbi:MAG: gliding motility-associated C-terminal domain-containing protein [Flavobacteriales bacterium]|jgi:gliding motility-associated-like protein|nr:gliding motility-associated C-terminal domain-containing protein [Flavobacteriales bacterium]